MAKLTTKFLESVKPAPARREIPDAGCRGLYLVVQPTGRKAWVVRYRYRGDTRKLTLDPGLSLAEARKAATAALHELERGNDPAVLKFDAQAKADKAAADRARDTVDALAHQFIEQHAKRKTRQNSWRQAVHVFDDIVLPVWRGRTIHDIKRRDIRELVEAVAVDRPIMANRALGHLSRFFNWLLERDVLEASPCAGIKLPARERPRDRVLDDDELRRLWLACEAIGGAAGACVKLLMLTGQRRTEIAHLKWMEVNGNLLVLPAERMKGRAAHIVPLSTRAVEIITSLPQTGEYVFGKAPVGHFHRIKPELDARMGDTAPWVIHDIRRSVASGMAKIGVAVQVIEKILAHRSGTFRGIVSTYQRHTFVPEMAAALEHWSAHIERVVSGKSADVISMGR